MPSGDQDVRERIIDAAREKFLTLGFSKVTMDELAAGLGISKKTMYQNFRSKDDLVDAVFDWQMRYVGGRLDEAMNAGGEFVERLYRVWRTVGEVISRFSRQMQDDLRRFRPDLWKRIEETRRGFLTKYFHQLVDEGMAIGIIREKLDRDLLMLIYISAIQGVINPEVLVHHSFSAAEAFRTIQEVMFEGILTDDARTRLRRHLSPERNAQ